MRKILSFVMVLAMLVSAMCFTAVPASAGVMEDIYGYTSAWPQGSTGFNAVEALYFESEPTIDGYISEAEWGTRTVRMSSDNAATVDDSSPYYASFFYWVGAEGDSGTDDTIEYDIWFRWSEQYFYVGVKVRDYDGHSLKHGKGNTWNGDAIQFRVDYNMHNASGDVTYPWSYGTTIPNIMAGYSQIAGGFIECWDDASETKKGLTAYSNPYWGPVLCAVAPAGMDYTPDTAAGYTTYELAIPWKYIVENEKYNAKENNDPVVFEYAYFTESANGIIGWELGVSLTVLNAMEGDNKYSSYLSWGTGVTGTNPEGVMQPAATASGSNAVVISDAKHNPQGYATYDPSKLEANAGTGNVKADTVFYDYHPEADRAVAHQTADTLTTLTYDSDDDRLYWGADQFLGSRDDVGGEHGWVLEYDRALTNETTDDGQQIIAGVSPVPQYYLGTEIDSTIKWTFPTSYTFEFDIMYTGTEISAGSYDPVLMNWFGGAGSVEYECGYSFNDKQFVVRDANSNGLADKLASYNFDLKQDTWYNWKFQYDNESCTMRLYIDDVEIFNLYNRYFYYSSEDVLENGCGLYFWFINTQVKFDNVKFYNFYAYSDGPGSDVSGGGNQGPTTSTEEGGEDIKTDVSVRDDGTFTVAVNAKAQYKTATELSYKFSFNTADYEIVGVEGLEEGDYELTEQADGSYVLKITNLKKIKEFSTGDKMFDLVFKGKTEGATADGLAIKLADSYKYTVTTGDAMLYIVLAAVVMMASAAAVVIYRKRRATDII